MLEIFLFLIKLQHGCRIQEAKYKSYIGGEIDYFDICDAKSMSVHDINRMVESCGHSNSMLYYYIDPRSDLTHSLMELQTEENIKEFYRWTYKLMEVYCDHMTLEEICMLQAKKRQRRSRMIFQ